VILRALRCIVLCAAGHLDVVKLLLEHGCTDAVKRTGTR
jgi:hypothetical protein